MAGYKNPPKEHQFQPGQTGNPAGSSRRQRITSALLELIDERKARQPLATVWLKLALEGDFRFFRELLDRIEGPIGPLAEASAADEDIATLREHLKKTRRSRKAS